MKIFGINFTTKKELKHDLRVLQEQFKWLDEAFTAMCEDFPFDLGQVVYDVALKNDKGRYTKTKPSLEYSTITEVTVTTKNYFSLVERFNRDDVFFDRESAEEYLNSVCE